MISIILINDNSFAWGMNTVFMNGRKGLHTIKEAYATVLSKKKQILKTIATIGAIGVVSAASYGIYQVFSTDRPNVNYSFLVNDRKVEYSARTPISYSPLAVVRNGYATLVFDEGYLTVNDSTLKDEGLSLDEIVSIELPDGKIIDFNFWGVIDDAGKLRPYKEGSELQNLWQANFKEIQSLYNLAEDMVQNLEK